jgi:hypothetical protein
MAKKKAAKKPIAKTGKRSARKAIKKTAKKTAAKSAKKATKKGVKKTTKARLEKTPKRAPKSSSKRAVPEPAPEMFQASCITCSWKGYVGTDRSMAMQDAQFHESEMMQQHQSHSTTVQPATPLPPADTVARPDEPSDLAL